MKTIEKIAIKYLLIGFGVGILDFLVVYSQVYFFELFEINDQIKMHKITFNILAYSSNIIIAIFILADSIKFTKNKILLPLLGFCMPVFGVCFLILEKYLIQKSINNESNSN